ncbi:type VI secretion system baseplate subunit TssG [Inhella proteolytica]|uniref:Type VI secretion system baseplate subunit TssG n=1 Tax=Inhella proteolytica TaxID=2795029 RepID=A0A931J1D4_9BURK|nr:type VI secretion system baseplate subunit TssG [Inhella proteolytica]MBH9577734.1 type VI secretion system baseplate subunit TssG [Inhella proteolytica]
MARATRTPARRLSGAESQRLRGLLRSVLAGQGRTLEGLPSDWRSRWRVLRTVLARADAAAVLAALQLDQRLRRGLQDLPAQAWTTDQALAALGAEDVQPSLFAALRLLQAAQPGHERLGYSSNPDREAVRIDQALLLGFAPKEVVSLQGPDAKRARARVAQHALGLLGPNGAMPYAWTQHARDLQSGSQRQEDRQSFVAFLNVLQRRQLGLLYRAWADAQAVLGVDAELAAPEPGASQRPHAGHPLADRLAALAGLAHGPLAARDLIPPAFKQAFAATLSRRVRSPASLAGMLGHYFGLRVRVQEFRARWLPIPKEERSRLGQRFARLGQDAVAGAQVWDCSSRFRLVLGPLSLADYERFLPSAPAHQELRDLVALYVGPEWDWELQLVLRASDAPAARLAPPGAQGGQGLGWTQWLGRRAPGRDADDYCQPMRPSFDARPQGLHAPHGP